MHGIIETFFWWIWQSFDLYVNVFLGTSSWFRADLTADGLSHCWLSAELRTFGNCRICSTAASRRTLQRLRLLIELDVSVMAVWPTAYARKISYTFNVFCPKAARPHWLSLLSYLASWLAGWTLATKLINKIGPTNIIRTTRKLGHICEPHCTGREVSVKCALDWSV